MILKRLTYDLIDVLKDVIIYKNTQDIDILFVLSKDDIDNLVPYILIEEAFKIIDILIEASSHYSQSLDAKTYFELAMLKICNNVKDENKVLLEEENNFIEKTKKVEEIKKEDDSEKLNKIEEITPETAKLIDQDNDLKKEENKNVKDDTEQKVSNKNIDVSFDDILNILVQADRRILNEIKEKWSVLQDIRSILIQQNLLQVYDGNLDCSLSGRNYYCI